LKEASAPYKEKYLEAYGLESMNFERKHLAKTKHKM
jgi:hypothetical protein